MKILKGEKLHLRKRFGLDLPGGGGSRPSLWIHAVSVGEVLSLQNLILEIKKRHPDWKIYFSSLTNTGFRMAEEKLGQVDNIFFVPFDFACVARRFFSAYNPRLFILAESEFWPNLLRVAGRATRGVLLINGRISERSFKRYCRLRPMVRKVLKNIDHFLVQTDHDRMKLENLGVNSRLIEVAGNLKTETALPDLADTEILELKKSLGIGKGVKVIVAGSTHKGEEEILLDAFKEARGEREDLLLILAPRHPSRTGDVEKVCGNSGFEVLRRTEVKPGDNWDVLILDTIGELARFYALSDAAFIGGSLVPRGGQNLLEPAFYRKPIFFGPHMENFLFLAEKFIGFRAARIIQDREDLKAMFLLRDEESLGEMGCRARSVLDSLQGATEKTLSAIESHMTT